MKKAISFCLFLIMILGSISVYADNSVNKDEDNNGTLTVYPKKYEPSDSQVLIDGIYYELDSTSYEATAVYSKRKGSVLRYPNYVTYKNKKYKVTIIWASIDSSGEVAIFHKYPYKEVYLPKYAESAWFTGVVLKSLRKVHVPENVQEIWGLDNCSKVKIIIDKKNKYLRFKNGAIYSKDGKELYELLKAKKVYKVSKGTKRLRIYNDKIEKIIFPNDLTVIENYFVSSDNLKTIKLGKNTKKIGMFFFQNSISLKSVVFPKTLKKIDDNAFAYCKNFKKAVFQSTKHAPKLAFWSFKDTADGIRFYVKNQTVADELLNEFQTKQTGVKNANIYVGDTLVYSNINYSKTN